MGKKLTATRRRWMIDDSDDARLVVTIIDDGLSRGQGRPAALDLPQLGAGWPGLNATRQAIAELKDRRAVLVEELPSKSDTAGKTKEAEARAAEIRTRAAELTVRTAAAEAALNEAALVALSVAEDARSLWEDNVNLDKLTTDADISRPDTPGAAAPSFRVAMPLSALLRGHFQGAQPLSVDTQIADQICAGVSK